MSRRPMMLSIASVHSSPECHQSCRPLISWDYRWLFFFYYFDTLIMPYIEILSAALWLGIFSVSEYKLPLSSRRPALLVLVRIFWWESNMGFTMALRIVIGFSCCGMIEQYYWDINHRYLLSMRRLMLVVGSVIIVVSGTGHYEWRIGIVSVCDQWQHASLPRRTMRRFDIVNQSLSFLAASQRHRGINEYISQQY